MLSYLDIEHRNIVIIGQGKSITWAGGLIVVKDRKTDEVLTRLAVHKILLIMVLGNTSITTPLLERCKKYKIPLIFAKNNFRITAFIGAEVEGNTLLRQRQYTNENSLYIAKKLIYNKICNQIALLKKIRQKDEQRDTAIGQCRTFAENIETCGSIAEVMGFEGNAAKLFFRHYFGEYGWKSRKPRIKTDYLNVILDIGYTFLFHYVETMLRLWGFDLYMGNLHQLWFQRKSLVCDMVESFRCIIDHQVRISLALRQFQAEDFGVSNSQCYLPVKKNRKYAEVFLNTIQEHKADIYYYTRDYYRYFMGMKSVKEMPQYEFS